MKQLRPTRMRVGLTPAGAGVLTLVFPGTLVSALARQRLLLALGIGAGLVLVANVVMARRALNQLDVKLRTPSIVNLGVPVGVSVELLSGGRPLECAIGTSFGEREWTPAVAPVTGEVTVVFGERGAHTSMSVWVRTTIPFALITCKRTFRIKLAEPLYVAPVAVSTAIPDPPSIGEAAAYRGGGESVGLRPYSPGDPQRDVHWPTVARTGMMMVRDRRDQTEAMEVLLSAEAESDDDFEIVVGRLRAVVDQLLAKGNSVQLSIYDRIRRQQTTEPVRSSTAAATRLATAANSPTRTPRSETIAGPHLTVDREGARWLLDN